MGNWTKFLACIGLIACGLMAQGLAAQSASAPPPASKPQTPPENVQATSRITIEVTGGEKNVPVENASVYVKFVEEHAVKKNKTLEMNVKTSQEGVAHVPNTPMGRALVQVVADGWKTYGHWYDITDPKQTIKIHLDRPTKWY
jgi:hypothetical protein